MAEAAPVEAVETAKVPPVVEQPERPKPTLETFAGVDWATIPEEAKTKLQEEVDRRIKVARENAARRAAKERDAYWKGRESVRPETPQKPAEPIVEEPKAPTRDQFQSYEEFLEAKAEFVADRAAQQAVKKVSEKEREEKQTKAKAELFQSFQAKVRQKFPDIEERLEPIGHIEMPPGMGDAIAESELGPEILDFLAQNAKECERIAGLSSTAAAREIGKIEARLEKPAAPAPSANGAEVPEKPTVPAASTPKQPSAAPAPLKPGGGGGPSDDTPRDTDSIDDWMRKERARARKKYG